MSFVETRFPEDISYGSSGGPAYATTIAMTDGGYEKRNVHWGQARARYNVGHGVKTPEQLAQLIAFFRARKGRAYGFRFKDWSDFQAIAQPIGLGDGATRTFQLVKLYSDGGVSERRVLTKPVAGSVQLSLNGVLQTSGVMVDATTGLATFAAAPSAGVQIAADCEFDVPVRFDTDSLSATLDAYRTQSWRNIILVEIRI